MTKSVLKLLEDNRNTVQALKREGGAMEIEQNDAGPTTSGGDDRPVQDVLEDILSRESWKDKRASKLGLDDFLQLLSEFNEAGIHFS